MTTPVHGPPWRSLLFLAAAVAWPAAGSAQTVQVDEPRAYGYFVGDTVERTVHIDLPPGTSIDTGSLPQPGRRGKALELRSMAWRQGRELRLEYQVMLSPREPRVLEMPALELRVADAAGRATVLRVEAWPVAVVPLVAAEAPSRRGFGDLQADRPPPVIDTSTTRQRLLAYGVAALLLAAYLVHVYVALPWWARYRRPFGQAWQRLQALPAEPDALQRRQAWAQVHAALNRTAGATLFEAGIERFIDEQPRYAGLRAELQAFFDRSRRAFFAEAPAQDDLPWLLAFCRRCRDAERGAA
jgi:mxaA protein